MKIVFDPKLIEQVVDEVIRERAKKGDTTLRQIFSEITEQAYSPMFTDMRQDIFVSAYEYVASKLELRIILKKMVTEFPLLSDRVTQLIVKRPEGKQEGGDIHWFDSPSGTQEPVLILEINAKSLNPDNLQEAFFYHEFMRCQDMIDKRFDYKREPLDKLTVAEEQIIRLRYSILWDIYIDSRLALTDKPPLLDDTMGINRISAAFLLDRNDANKVRELIVNSKGGFTHGQLFEYSSKPEILHKILDIKLAEVAYPGSSCPVCNFPSFNFELVKDGDLLEVIQTHIGRKTGQISLCPRCYEFFQVKLGRF